LASFNHLQVAPRSAVGSGSLKAGFRRILLLVGSACTLAAQAQTAGASNQDACLPITMPTADVLFNSPKKVFAHYFYMFPLSIDNKPSAQDYYNVQHLSKSGESGKWARQGGFLRQRPLGGPVISAPNWRLLNVENEVRMAIARGITGFTIDVLSVKEATDDNSHLHLLLRAAHEVDGLVCLSPLPLLVVSPDRPVQPFLVGEVVVKQANAGPGLLGNIGNARLLVPMLDEVASARVEQPASHAVRRLRHIKPAEHGNVNGGVGRRVPAFTSRTCT